MDFYILCGAHAKSGGPELAHQFCYTINTITKHYAKMCYVDLKASLENCLPADVDAEEKFKIYQTEHAVSMDEIDREENVVIIPEGLSRAVGLFSKAFLVLWWMSVDNYITSTNEENLDLIEEKCGLHLVQSYYAKLYAEKHFSSKILWLTDYINLQHGTFLYPAAYRQNIALYNPAKGYEKLQPLIEKADWIQWIPLVNMDLEKTILFMQNAKIYVDLGNHPGKDRIPREAAVNGCCVITNKEGSAAYQEDVPIPEEYKFDRAQDRLDEIELLMHDICNDFITHQKRFEEYREWIHREKERFDGEVAALVTYLEEKKE